MTGEISITVAVFQDYSGGERRTSSYAVTEPYNDNPAYIPLTMERMMNTASLLASKSAAVVFGDVRGA